MPGQGIRRLLRNLTEASALLGLLSTLSYAAEFHGALRTIAPAAGAWWNRYEFHFMEGAATALGLLIALQLGLRFARPEASGRLALAALALDAVLVVPLTHLCAAAARVGADASTWAASGRISSITGYALGKLFDKLLIAGVYFLKTAGFAFLLGLGLFGAVLVVALAGARGGGPVEAAHSSPTDRQ